MLQPSLKSSSVRVGNSDFRYFVPDLSPHDRRSLKNLAPRQVFIAESPHISEVEPEDETGRRPLCGVAGRQWWSLLSELLDGQIIPPDQTDVSVDRLVHFCMKHQIAVLNSVQVPLDPKVARLFPEADPVQNLGFSKATGEFSYKKLKKTEPVQVALQALKVRLQHPSLENATLHCLGNDAEWFVLQALGPEDAARRLGPKIPHPSAWWRRGGLFGRTARERLIQIFNQKFQ